MTDSSPLLKLENVSREFPSAEGDQPLRVLRGLSLEVARGESVAVVGSLLAALLLWRRGIKSGLEGFARERFQDVFRWGSISIAFAAAADAACGCGLLDYRIGL